MLQETTNNDEFAALQNLPAAGRILAIDPGTKRIGVAVCDESQSIARGVSTIPKTSWKKLLACMRTYILEFDAAALVIGLPLNTDGSESEMCGIAREMERKFRLSVEVPVFLQDERGTSYEARGRLWAAGYGTRDQRDAVDSEAASIILSDFLDRLSHARKQPLLRS